ncbi:LCP family protein [Paenibacillus sp. SI8]|uniref:LCP family glycopolymer transferase n=1 Tax=unclassified Paenibacillus TaxID=185978 RepID=UPI0034650D08
MYCTKCGEKLHTDDLICSTCETPVHTTQSQSTNESIGTPTIHHPSSTIPESDLILFVGKRSEVYANKWKRNTNWNWAAFVFDAYWMMYRRMYLYCLCYVVIASLIVNFIGFLLPERGFIAITVALLVYGVIKVVFARMANKIYLHQAKRKIHAIIQIPFEQASRERQIVRAGGTSLAVPLTLILLPFVLALTVSVFYFYNSYRMVNNTLQTMEKEHNKIDVQSTPLPRVERTAPVHILLLGGDSHEKNELPRSDSMMVASIDPVTKKAYLFSILRDTSVNMPNYGEERINRAITSGGPELAMQTVSEFMDIPIHYYVYTDLQGFISLIDNIGGIDLEVDKNMKYADSNEEPMYAINLKKGMQHLDGRKALQYVRFRHDALSDFARTERQRKFMQVLIQKLTSTSTAVKLPKLWSAFEPFIETNLSMNEITQLGSLLFDIKADRVVTVQLPPMEMLQEKSVNGVPVLTVDPDKLHGYVKGVLEGASP